MFTQKKQKDKKIAEHIKKCINISYLLNSSKALEALIALQQLTIICH